MRMAGSSREFHVLMARSCRHGARLERLEDRRFLSVAPLPALLHRAEIAVVAFEISIGRPTVDAPHELTFERPVNEATAALELVLPLTHASEVVSASLAAEIPRFKASGTEDLNPPINEPLSPRILAGGPAGGLDGQNAARHFVLIPDLADTGFEPVTFFGFLRSLDLVRASLFEVSIAVPVTDAARATMSRSGHDIETLETSRHATPNSPAGMGQNVDSESGLVLDRLTTVEPGMRSARADGLTNSPPKTVSHLVAEERAAPNQAVAASQHQPLEGDGLAASMWHDLLLPRLSYDAAVFGAALADFVSEAEELGVGLLTILADIPVEGEMALVAGLIGGGIAYRHAREGRRRERAEEQEVLRARFIDVPASVRLRGRAIA